MRPTWIRLLSAPETRVLGSLLEKQRTTPDAYPLSLNALRLACNQSTNRDPVVDYDEALIRDALHRLERHGITRLASGAGSRAAKYRHLLAEALPLDAGEQAILCVLMLRGAQTPGELKQRTERMHRFADLAAVHATLEQLLERELVERLERRPGQKEERYAQLLQQDDAYEHSTQPQPRPQQPGQPQQPIQPQPSAQPQPSTWPQPSAQPQRSVPEPAALADLVARIERLEREVAELRADRRHAVGEPQL